ARAEALARRAARNAALDQAAGEGRRQGARRRTPRRRQGQGLRGRDVLGVFELHARAQRHVPQVRHVWQHDGVFVTDSLLRNELKGRSYGRPFVFHGATVAGRALAIDTNPVLEARMKLELSKFAISLRMRTR